MFWNRWFNKNGRNLPQKAKLKPPIDLPKQVGQYLIVKLGRDPDWVWDLKAVVKPFDEDKKSGGRFRIYDPIQAAKQWIKIHHYHSLDDYPELTLYEGYYDKNTNTISVSGREPVGVA